MMKIQNLLGGVSQRPPDQREPNQFEILENALVSQEHGVRKRPPTVNIGQIIGTTTGYDDSFVYQINRSPTERYVVVVGNGDLQVFDAFTGAQQTVAFPDGKAYLALGSRGARACQVGDYTFIVNRDKVVKRGLKKAPAIINEGLIFVRMGDYNTNYVVTINQEDVKITTPTEAVSTSRDDIATDQIASTLFTELTTNTQTLQNEFTFTLMGSTIHLKRNDGGDFTMSSADGLADKGLRTIKGKVEALEDLPAKARKGMVIEITGSPGSPKDNTWVAYDGFSDNEGVWRETTAPGVALDLDASTMPHQLVRQGVMTPPVAAMGLPSSITNTQTPGTLYTNGWTTDGADVALTGVEADSKEVTTSGNAVRSPVVSGTHATRTRRVVITYDIDASQMFTGAFVDVVLSHYNGSAWSVLATQSWASGALKKGASFKRTMLVPAGSRFELKMNTRTDWPASEAPTKSRKVVMTAHGKTAPVPGIQITERPSCNVWLGKTIDKFPRGMVVAFTLDGVAFSQTLADDKTTAQLAQDLVTLVNGNATFSASYTPPGSFIFVDTLDGFSVANVTNGIAPVITAASYTFAPATKFWNSTLTMVAGDHVGRTVKNLTDGSSGVVTANSATAIIVGSLTGGTRNSFDLGDQVTVLGAGVGVFVFQRGAWGQRLVGNDLLSPYPTFVDRTINDAFFYAGRLGFLAEDFVEMSAANDLYRFFRRTVTQVLDDDPIDARNNHDDVSLFDSAVQWDGRLLICSSVGHQFQMLGDPFLSPATVRLEHLSSFQVTSKVKPMLLGASFVLPRKASGYVQAREVFRSNDGTLQSRNLTDHVPTYMAGDTRVICGDADLGFMAILPDGGGNDIFVFRWGQVGDQAWQSWGKWMMGGKIYGMDFVDGNLYIVIARSARIYLEKINVAAPVDSSDHRDAGSIAYTFKARPTRLYLRDKQGTPLTHGRTQVRTLELKFHDNGYFRVTVTPTNRTAMVYTVTAPVEGKKRIPILAENTSVTIEITNDQQQGCAFDSLEYEATYGDRG